MHINESKKRSGYAKLLSGIFIMILISLFFSSCGGRKNSAETADEWMGLTVEDTVKNAYAERFHIDRLAGGYRHIAIGGEDILIVPQGKDVPSGIPEKTTVLKQPVDKIYMASSSALSFFQELGCTERVAYTSTKASDWGDKNIRQMVEEDIITYVGKYNAPDYEWLITEGTGLAVENTMILHDPTTREKLEQLGIPVIMERSSYEAHPMGRMEWVKVYGCILGMEEAADQWFEAKDAKFRSITGEFGKEGTRIAYFSFSPNGYVNIQAPSGYFAELIRAAGGTYAFTAEDLKADEEDSSTMHISMDQFYVFAKDADILIYNAAIYGPIESIDKMTDENPLMKDFTAVQTGRVYCTSEDIFQKPTAVVEIIEELKLIMENKEDVMSFFTKVRKK